MAWTDDRVARLRELWGAGQSASQIATDLGGVTRNAVIGKVHRLGLSGRDRTGTGTAAKAKPAARAATHARAKPRGTDAAHRRRPPAAKPRTAPQTLSKTPAGTAPRTPPQMRASRVAPKAAPRSKPPVEPPSRARTMPSAPRIPQAVRDMAGRPFEPPREAVKLADGSYATVLTITDHMCKWPIGDPGSDAFRFCGRRTEADEPYCTAHSRVAYQPSRRRSASATALPPITRRKAIR